MDNDEKQSNYELAEKLLAEQNFAAATIAGAAAMLLAAVAYGFAVERWPFTYGFAAAGVGVVVGLAVGYFGRGIATIFAVLAGLYTIAGCILGNLLAVIINRTQGATSPGIEALRDDPVSTLAAWSVSGLTLIHFVFWFVAVFAAVFWARRPLSRAEKLAIGLLVLRDQAAIEQAPHKR